MFGMRRNASKELLPSLALPRPGDNPRPGSRRRLGVPGEASSTGRRVIFYSLVILFCFGAGLLTRRLNVQPRQLLASTLLDKPKKTLVLYVFAASDPEYEANLRFFVREGIREGDGNKYVIIIQHGVDLLETKELPALPKNAEYVEHKNECFDLGTAGWYLKTHPQEVKKYPFIIFLNSSVRGPFLPAYMQNSVPWTHVFTSKITEEVRLVGSTINCGRAYESLPVAHVQSYAMATDQAGLQILMHKAPVFRCWKDMRDVVVQGEMGASKAILDAGYQIDSLMLRYQGLDWYALKALACNNGQNPIQNSFYDGINVDPLEVMFIKVKESMKVAHWSHVLQAMRYDEWSEMARNATAHGYQDRLVKVAGNRWNQEVVPKLMADAQTHGPTCFDREFYVHANPHDLNWILDQPQPQVVAWNHFVTNGIYEGRPFRFTC